MHVRFPVAASADRVWTKLADFGGMARWSPDLAMSTQIARQGIQVGAVRELTFIKPVAGTRTIRERIIQCGEQWFSYILDGGFGPYGNAGSTWRVVPEGSDQCTIEVTSFLEDGPWWAMALRPIAYLRLERGLKRALRGLEKRVAGQ